MTFNPEKIKQLAEGKAILGHTKKEADLDLLKSVIKAAFPNDTQPFRGGMDYYLAVSKNTSYWQNYNKIHLDLQHLPIIPLHDFVSPTKEEKQIIDTIDARLKELEKITFELKHGFNVYNSYKSTTTAPKEEQPKEVLPQAKQGFDVAIREERFGDHYYIQVSNRATGFTKEQAEKYAEKIKNALNHG